MNPEAIAAQDCYGVIGVALVVGVRLYREALARVLAVEPGLELRCASSRPPEAVALIQRTRPDVVLFEVTLPGALAAVRRCHATVPSTRMVAIAFDGREESALAAAEAGVGGYIGVDQPLGDVPKAIRGVMRGEAPCDGRTAAILLRRVAADARSDDHAGVLGELTGRERLILQHVARGHSNKEIASELVIGVATVKTHVHAILGKLGVSSRGAAADLLRRSEMVAPPR